LGAKQFYSEKIFFFYKAKAAGKPVGLSRVLGEVAGKIYR
jgi:hypothetical protein